MTPITATIGALTFAIDGSSPHTLASMQGWYSGAPKRVVVDDLPNANGASDVSTDYRGARVITLSGLLSSVSVDDATTNVWAAFAALQTDGSPSLFTVTDAGGAKSCVVSVTINEITPLTDGLASYVLQLVARDPVKYSAARDTVTGLPVAGGGLQYNLFAGGAGGTLYYGANGYLGRATLMNLGTARVWPKLLVLGGLTAGFFVQRLDTGQVVRYDRVIPDGSSLSVDFRTGEVLIDGLSDGSAYLTRYEFFSIGPGESVEVQFNAISGSSGTPTATFTNADGYW